MRSETDMATALVDKIKSVIQPHHETTGHCCSTLSSGPGYASPLEALKGPREKLLYITAVYTGPCSDECTLGPTGIIARS